MRRTILITLFALSTVCIMSGCKAKHEKLDLTTIHTTAATESHKETLAPETSKAEEETTAGSSDNTANVTAQIFTETAGGHSIQYPTVSNMADQKKQETVNQLLHDNAVAITKTLAEDASVSISCKVTSVDRKRLTAVYTGTYTTPDGAYPTNVFYTNTVDLEEGKDLGFNDYADAYTMAGYVMSEDCQFIADSKELEDALLAYRKDQSLEYFTELFNSADFPLDHASIFPESFSYTDKGVLYFSIPVPHALGDYALVEFNMDGK